ncbi:hypothetical protein APUTEX25_001798 [Auxenochlorella protothecoides]|uniref:Ig-like domain-containing protein n=2 Tax=Auxenochlorella protothecoides TaxID=3075 RepID=A0A3M7L4D3_AUXPR|nr:hypothetical protein APUTEX25_001798 [Auxenochlorella protothecoides]|eukprot:RMZ57598.1 hypothetical protein APUTEX25_001798 [Auxenochlorella protothecoides]
MGWSTAALVACGLTLTLGAVCASADNAPIVLNYIMCIRPLVDGKWANYVTCTASVTLAALTPHGVNVAYTLGGLSADVAYSPSQLTSYTTWTVQQHTIASGHAYAWCKSAAGDTLDSATIPVSPFPSPPPPSPPGQGRPPPSPPPAPSPPPGPPVSLLAAQCSWASKDAVECTATAATVQLPAAVYLQWTLGGVRFATSYAPTALQTTVREGFGAASAAGTCFAYIYDADGVYHESDLLALT